LFNCVDRYIQHACEYVRAVANHDDKKKVDPQGILWGLVVRDMEHLDRRLSSKALSQLQKVMEEDRQAKKKLERAFELIAKV
jgi:hypothetical protein